MKKTALSVLMAVSALASAPAFAQASGTVDVSGTVAAKCAAVTPLTGNITLGELAKSDGTVDAAFSANSGGLTRNFTVRCNGANPKVAVNARPLVNAAAQNSPAGYTNTVHYTASVTAKTAQGSSAVIADESLSAGATVGNLGDRIAATADNISLRIGSGLTTDAAAILEAGTYQGSVEIVVSPTA
ncbi:MULTISPECIES: hypothetical protein [unclassified Sphingomonas]|uniref:hypothetical protein n=1 Tax=unclassified Sphingomonas TaxID=196159 RepID=UPI001D11477B|nr:MULTISPECIES: hypothetical protein [unclassified Sphingomonas]MCC2980033.1 hypothetical protein [Sphingomonas sp. IC4-52]MCD2314795.1 hypothetical protein [Sphingomonas sp. IC-11]